MSRLAHSILPLLLVPLTLLFTVMLPGEEQVSSGKPINKDGCECSVVAPDTTCPAKLIDVEVRLIKGNTKTSYTITLAGSSGARFDGPTGPTTKQQEYCPSVGKYKVWTGMKAPGDIVVRVGSGDCKTITVTGTSCTTKRTYSRGDDQRGPCYQTAKIDATITVAACCPAEPGTIRIDFSATIDGRPGNPDAGAYGPAYKISETDQSAANPWADVNSAAGTYTNVAPANPDSRGDTLVASLVLKETVPCNGVQKKGKVVLRANLQGRPGIPPAGHPLFPRFADVISQWIEWTVTVKADGTITCDLTLVEVEQLSNPPVPTTVSPARDITAGGAGYPAFPGVPRNATGACP